MDTESQGEWTTTSSFTLPHEFLSEHKHTNNTMLGGKETNWASRDHGAEKANAWKK